MQYLPTHLPTLLQIPQKEYVISIAIKNMGVIVEHGFCILRKETTGDVVQHSFSITNPVLRELSLKQITDAYIDSFKLLYGAEVEMIVDYSGSTRNNYHKDRTHHAMQEEILRREEMLRREKEVRNRLEKMLRKHRHGNRDNF